MLLQELGLSCAEELFDYEFFQADPRPFYKFARNLYFPLGNNERVRPSDSHKLLALLEQKKMLLRVYSQNIDGTMMMTIGGFPCTHALRSLTR
jgi:NAD-dependent SIR2 family protein deacetylase